MNYLKKFVVWVFAVLSPDYGIYFSVIVKNKVLRWFYPIPEHKYLFVLSAPYCGSTLLNEILMSSKNVSVNNVLNSRQYEGQKLPSTSKLMFAKKKRWDISYEIDWIHVKKEWLKYWDQTKPVLLEKSPPNIIRAQQLANCFKPSYFIVLYRNPYAHCEGVIRRTSKTAIEAATRVIELLTYQKNNIENLDDVIAISYECLTNNASESLNSIKKWMNELHDIKINGTYKAHSQFNKRMSVNNLNQQKIDNLGRAELEAINSVFSKNEDVLHYFGYELIH